MSPRTIATVGILLLEVALAGCASETVENRSDLEGINRLSFNAPQDRYAGQLKELARIIRGEIPNPPGLYLHDLKVHKVSFDACNLKSEDIK